MTVFSRSLMGASTALAITALSMAMISRGVDTFPVDRPVGSWKRVFLRPSARALAFMAAVSCGGVSFTERPSAGMARLSDPMSAEWSRSRFDSVIPSSSRERAPPLAISMSPLLMVESPSSSTPFSATTSVAASLEMEAMGRSLSAFLANTVRPVSSTTTGPCAVSATAWSPGARLKTSVEASSTSFV